MVFGSDSGNNPENCGNKPFVNPMSNYGYKLFRPKLVDPDFISMANEIDGFSFTPEDSPPSTYPDQPTRCIDERLPTEYVPRNFFEKVVDRYGDIPLPLESRRVRFFGKEFIDLLDSRPDEALELDSLVTFLKDLPRSAKPEELEPPTVVNRQLRDVFQPLCLEAATAGKIDEITAAFPEVMRQVANFSHHKLNYGNEFALSKLPMETFMGAELPDIETLRSLSTEEIYEMADTAALRYHLIYEQRKNFAKQSPDGVNREMPPSPFLRSLFRYEFVSAVDDSTLDPNHWNEYRRQLLDLPFDEQTLLGNMQQLRAINAMRFSHEDYKFPTSQHGEFIYMFNPLGATESHVVKNIVVPIGAYGEAFALQLARTTALLQAIAFKQGQTSTHETNIQNEALIKRYTARGSIEKNDNPSMVTLQEGILSIMQSISLLTSRHVEGYDDPLDLVRTIVSNGLIEKFAAMTPAGIVGPMAVSGKSFPHTLKSDKNGLELHNDFIDYMKRHKKEQVDRTKRSRTEMTSKSGVIKEGYIPLGKVCPVSEKGGGIRKLADSYIDILEYVVQSEQTN